MARWRSTGGHVALLQAPGLGVVPAAAVGEGEVALVPVHRTSVTLPAVSALIRSPAGARRHPPCERSSSPRGSGRRRWSARGDSGASVAAAENPSKLALGSSLAAGSARLPTCVPNATPLAVCTAAQLELSRVRAPLDDRVLRPGPSALYTGVAHATVARLSTSPVVPSQIIFGDSPLGNWVECECRCRRG